VIRTQLNPKKGDVGTSCDLYQLFISYFSISTHRASIPGVKVVTTTAHGQPHETTTRGKQPDALITVPQPPGLYGPLLSPPASRAQPA
jgi:hypothetical protein